MTLKVYYVSDGTGITAEALGESLLSQFEMEYDALTMPYIDNRLKAETLRQRIDQDAKELNTKPLIFSTLVDSEIRDILQDSEAVMFDLFGTFVPYLEETLGKTSLPSVGRSHGVIDYERYKLRIDAVNFALANDDGVGTHNYKKADVILVGVSRSGKTPTCLYLALQYGIFAANYPFTEDDLTSARMPEHLLSYKEKLFGLTIDANRLAQIRGERRPGSRYASREQCQKELSHVERLFSREHISYIDSTRYSIEEIATKILTMTNLQRRC